MSDNEKVEECPTDTQMTYYENAETESQNVSQSNVDPTLNESEGLNESQDFHLFDIEDTPELITDKSQQMQEKPTSQNEEEKPNETNAIESLPVVENIPKSEIVQKTEQSTTKEKIETEQKETSIDVCKSDAKEYTSDDEDDVIQGTPPHIHSPSKKQGTNVYGMSTLKRKTETLGEPTRKILRTSFREDALTIEREKFDETEESSKGQDKCEKTTEDDDVIADTETLEMVKETHTSTTIIIQESQEISELAEEPATSNMEGILKKAEKDLNDRMQECSERPGFSLDKTEKESNEDTKESSPKEIHESTSHFTKRDPSMERSKEGDDNIEVSAESNKSELNQRELKDTKSADIKPHSSESKVELLHTEKDTNPKPKDGNAKSMDKDRNVVQNIESSEVNLSKKEHSPEKRKDTHLSDRKSDEKDSDTASETRTSRFAKKSRMSIEVVFDRKSMNQENRQRPSEIVEIDESGEKIVLDSSQEESNNKSLESSCLNSKNETVYKSCFENKNSSSDSSYKSIANLKELSTDSKSDNQLTNGSNDMSKNNADIFVEESTTDRTEQSKLAITQTSSHSLSKEPKITTSTFKENDNSDILIVSDSEGDHSNISEQKKCAFESDLSHNTSLAKTLTVEREIGFYVKMKCTLHFDEATKEIALKEVTSIQCESSAEEASPTRHRANDTFVSMADVSGTDNKDSSPGSVTSNAQPYQLNPSRLSTFSSASSSSSSSGTASVTTKMTVKEDSHFSLPRVPAKHAKKNTFETIAEDKRPMETASIDRLTKEWKNTHLLFSTILNTANSMLSSGDLLNGGGVDHLEDSEQKILSSTPDPIQDLTRENVPATSTTTPKNTKKSRGIKRTRSRSAKASRSNGSTKTALNMASSEIPDSSGVSSLKKSSQDVDESEATTESISPLTPVRQSVRTVEALRSLTPQNVPSDDLIGKEVFAKWSDNNYYPGKVVDRSKIKYKVNFYDGKNKLLMEEFIIPIPAVLSEGLSVFATTNESDYGSSGIIIKVDKSKDDVHYTVETDEGEKIRIQIKGIFLTSDQAQLLREATSATDMKSPPQTPKQFSHVSLDNMIEGKRRSRRNATPSASTPRSKKKLSNVIGDNADATQPSVSGMAPRVLDVEKRYLEYESRTSDSNTSSTGETGLHGVEPEIIGTPNEQTTKGPQSRIKSKPRSKKKSEDQETLALLGPIPRAGSNIFKNVSFVLTCASRESIDRYRQISDDSNSESGTENEEEWLRTPFVRDRLQKQLIAGGGKVYENFDDIPEEEHKNTMLITNLPNVTAKSLLCLSVNIPAYSHRWVIRSCQENKKVSLAEELLPAGWSMDKRSYIDMFQRPSQKPLENVVVVIPVLKGEKQFSTFWSQVCQNAGSGVLIVSNPETSFIQGTVVLTNHRCPAWVVAKAIGWTIPLVSPTWIIQCLIEGKICHYDTQPQYKHDYIKA